jgi:hypothetical protein
MVKPGFQTALSPLPGSTIKTRTNRLLPKQLLLVQYFFAGAA